MSLRSKKIVLTLLLASGLLSLGNVSAQAQNSGARLQVFIHKNYVSGSLWDDYDNKIRVILKAGGSVIDQKLYPTGSRPTAPTNTNGDTGLFIGVSPATDTGVVREEGVVTFANIGANENYLIEIETESGGKIKRYVDDQTSNGTIASYSCEEAGTGTIRAKCSDSLELTSEDVTQAITNDRPFRINLVIAATDQQTENRPPEEVLTAGENAEYNEWVTVVGRFALRAQSLLDWSLQIGQDSFTNPTIDSVFGRILNIVNGFFILVLLAIAFLWNFSIIVPRRYLRQTVVLFVFAVVLVNFALPINKLLINVTGTLQNSFLVKDVRDADNPTQVRKEKITSRDILSTLNGDYNSFLGLAKSDYLPKQYPEFTTPPLFPRPAYNQFGNLTDLYVNRNQEAVFFNLALVAIGSVGQLLISLLIVMRVVILWFLLILSPFLFLLVLLRFLQQFFRYWSWLYIRWLFIGPLLAMCLFIMVNIWALTGVPVESTYAPSETTWFQTGTNLYLSAPGVTSGYLHTPREVMKYIVALLMLYMAVLLPFWLTRRLGTATGPGGKLWSRFQKKSTTGSEPANLNTSNISFPLLPTLGRNAANTGDQGSVEKGHSANSDVPVLKPDIADELRGNGPLLPSDITEKGSLLKATIAPEIVNQRGPSGQVSSLSSTSSNPTKEQNANAARTAQTADGKTVDTRSTTENRESVGSRGDSVLNGLVSQSGADSTIRGAAQGDNNAELSNQNRAVSGNLSQQGSGTVSGADREVIKDGGFDSRENNPNPSPANTAHVSEQTGENVSNTAERNSTIGETTVALDLGSVKEEGVKMERGIEQLLQMERGEKDSDTVQPKQTANQSDKPGKMVEKKSIVEKVEKNKKK